MLLIACVLAALPVRPLTPPGDQRVYPNEITTDTFAIIDASFDKGLVVYRHVYHLNERPPLAAVNEGEDDAPAQMGIRPPPVKECGYPGLKTLPKSGLTFGIYDLKHDRLQNAFTVFESTFGECTSQASATATLVSYEKAVRAAGLDPKKTLPLLMLPPPANGEQSFALTPKSGKVVKLRALNIRRVDADSPPNECGSGPMITMGKVERDAKTVWIRCQQDIIRPTAGGSFVFPSALIIGKRAVLVETFRFAAHETGAADREIWSFSKVLSLD